MYIDTHIHVHIHTYIYIVIIVIVIFISVESNYIRLLLNIILRHTLMVRTGLNPHPIGVYIINSILLMCLKP